MNALRFSVEWSRIEPQRDHWDAAALKRYRAMLKALLQRNIRPMVCLHHFTHPRWFEQDGAFLALVEELGDLCSHWVTFNEPNVYGALGYVLGEFPPGRKGEIITAVHVVNRIAACHAPRFSKIARSGAPSLVSLLNANHQVRYTLRADLGHPPPLNFRPWLIEVSIP